MGVGLDNSGGDETRVFLAGVFDPFDLKADAREGLHDLGQRGCRVEVIFVPGEREFDRTIKLVGGRGASCDRGVLARSGPAISAGPAGARSIDRQAARRIGREEEEQLRCARCREHGGLRPTFSASFDDGAKRKEGRQHN